MTPLSIYSMFRSILARLPILFSELLLSSPTIKFPRIYGAPFPSALLEPTSISLRRSCPRRRATMRILLQVVSLAVAACAVRNAPRSAAASSSFQGSALSTSVPLSAVPSPSAPIASGSSFASSASVPSFSGSVASSSAASQPFFNATSTIVATTLSQNASSASASATTVQTTVGVQPPGNPAQKHSFSPFPTPTQQPVAGMCA